MNASIPLECNMGVFTPVQRRAHILSTTELMGRIETVQELENGYQFIFPIETELLTELAEFISNERLCCPFLKFALSVSQNKGSISLDLTGPLGTQEFLRSEFSGAFQ